MAWGFRLCFIVMVLDIVFSATHETIGLTGTTTHFPYKCVQIFLFDVYLGLHIWMYQKHMKQSLLALSLSFVVHGSDFIVGTNVT